MREIKIPQAVALVLLMGALSAGDVAAQTQDREKSGKSKTQSAAQVEITSLLREFLSKVDSAEMHERFWADDLIYTGSSGTVKTKADILKGMREESAKADSPKNSDPKATYDAEDITVRQYGDAAVLNFQLVQHVSGKPDNRFRNTGTFVKRNGQWQAVVWQATKASD